MRKMNFLRISGVKFREIGVKFREIGVKFREIGVKFREIGVKFREIGVKFREIGGRNARIGKFAGSGSAWVADPLFDPAARFLFFPTSANGCTVGSVSFSAQCSGKSAEKNAILGVFPNFVADFGDFLSRLGVGVSHLFSRRIFRLLFQHFL